MSGEAVRQPADELQREIAAELTAAGFEAPRVIGRGGFGLVFRCREPALDRAVAVKVLRASPDSEGRARFLREQQVMGRLSGHPNIVHVLAAGVTHTGRPYIVMPFHSRDSLDALIERRGPREVGEVLDIGVKLAGALETTHRAGVLHRDIKPANILISEYGEPQLTDFGIARPSDLHDTTAGLVMGSPSYTAPELLHGQPPTVASDVYALGATLFTALAGRPAFSRRPDEDQLSQLLRISTDPIPDLRARGVPDSVCAVVERAMARDPADRPDSAAELGAELRRVGAELGCRVPDIPLPLTVRDEDGHGSLPGEPTPTAAYLLREPSSNDLAAARPPTVATKYRPPAGSHPTIRRTRLLERLGANDRARLILIHGPAGYGKTTLATQYVRMLEDEGRTIVWCSIDEDDNTPTWFLGHLVDAVALAAPELGAELIRILEGRGDGAERFVLTQLINRTHTADRHMVVVLDDWHRVTNPGSRAVARFLVVHGCHHQQLVVTSRTRRGLPLGSMRVQNELIEIDTTALRFDIDESRELLIGTAGLQLEEGDVAELEESTDGWAAALQLASLALREHHDPHTVIRQLSGRHRAVGEYLAENVLDNLEPDVLDFLLATSVPERISAALATELTGRRDAQAMLEEIEERDLFLTRLDEDCRWFRYHTLFAEFLSRRLERERPDRLIELHRVAARWFAGQRLLSPAVDHFLAAGDEDDAIDIVEKESIPLFERSQLTLLLGLAAKLPRGGADRPQLRINVAWAHALLHHRQEAADALGTLDTDLPPEPDDEALNRHAEALIVRATINGFDDRLDGLEAAVATGMVRAEKLRPWILCGIADLAAYREIHRFEFAEARRWQAWARPYHRSASGPFIVVYGYCLDSMAARELLDLEAVESDLRHAMHLATPRGEVDSYISRLAGALLGDLLYEQGHAAEAERLLDDSYTLGAEGGVLEFMRATYAVGALVKFRLGHVDEAAERLDEGDRLARTLRLPRLAAYITNERIRTDIGAAQFSADGFPPRLPEDPVDGIARVTAEVDERSAIRLLLASGDSDRAFERAQRLTDSIDSTLRPRAALYARSLLLECEATARSSAEVERTAVELLEQCARHGLVHPVLDAGPAVNALVRRIDSTRGTIGLSPAVTAYLDRYRELPDPVWPTDR